MLSLVKSDAKESTCDSVTVLIVTVNVLAGDVFRYGSKLSNTGLSARILLGDTVRLDIELTIVIQDPASYGSILVSINRNQLVPEVMGSNFEISLRY